MARISGSTRLAGILGWPVEHSLSPRMQNAAFEACGLDWAYVPFPTPPERFVDAVRGLAAAGLAGANVTAPHKLAAAGLCGSGLPSVNTLVFRDGAIEGVTTDAAILDAPVARDAVRDRAVVIGGGGAAAAFLAALPGARSFSRRSEWPPDVTGSGLVVNATPERDAVLVELRRGQTLIDLPYPETATARAAREAGATVIGGLEVLVAQGAASFELWTGVGAPVEAMRAALGLAA